MTPLSTERLLIRPFTLEDAPFILRLLNEPSFIDNIADKGVRTLAQAEAYLTDGPLASYATHGHGLWMVQHGTTGKPMGMCGLIKRDSLPEVDLGYAFCPEFWGLGYAREAAEACLAWGRDDKGLQSVLAIVSPGNAGSIRLLEALRFQFQKTMELTPGDEVAVYRWTA
ncbi:GNAT family N-acetyltransferase [Geothrix sp. PMB-07]|uniref:GNAT family N-acetyltransferase n=1 Tax=Geothrix sp. PMB-07 TaxID=3068640 RepID=UPI002742508F|nr:GNAT family N-acetyltransferase [Geothrix sp. PMB-07]WLT33452.1 GNAT family N-acetyltransferase [Geothrix sp. PMB-07]